MQTNSACNYLNLISCLLTLQNFHMFSPSGIFLILLNLTFTKPSFHTPISSQFLSTFFQTNFPGNKLTPVVNGPIPTIVIPRSYTILLKLKIGGIIPKLIKKMKEKERHTKNCGTYKKFMYISRAFF